MALASDSNPLDATTGTCLVLIRQGASHGYDVARHFTPDGSLGAVLTLSRPVVYRAIKTLEAAGFVESIEAVGVRGQLKWQLSCTSRGIAEADRWVNEPVLHVRELRTDFLLKHLLVKRVDGDLATLIRAQRTALESVTAHLLANRSDDVVAVWRREQARAAVRFLDELEGAARPIETEAPPSIGLSARNQLRAIVRSVKHGDILSSVRIEVQAGQTMTSTITREAVDELRLAPGSDVIALCKATDVMIASDQSMIA